MAVSQPLPSVQYFVQIWETGAKCKFVRKTPNFTSLATSPYLVTCHTSKSLTSYLPHANITTLSYMTGTLSNQTWTEKGYFIRKPCRWTMASSDKIPVACPASTGESKEPMGDPTKTTTAMLDKGTSMMQSMKPVRQMGLHVCSFACYSHDPGRQIEVHIYCHRVNQDFLQCAVYDSNSSKAHLIGTISFETWLFV